MEKLEIGIIGGSGLYDPSMVSDVSRLKVKTICGDPSDVFYIGTLNDKKVAFLSRHGKNHAIPPHELNFKANILGFERLGVKRIISCCAVGSLKEEYKPGDIIIPDQYIDWKKTMTTFYNTGDVTHVSMEDPFCPEIRRALIYTCKDLGIRHHDKGTYICIEGPRFSTRAESKMFRSFADIIGMTGVPEAFLARERELCLAILATVTDYDVWAEEPVSTKEVLKTMKENEEKVKQILREAVNNIPENRMCLCKEALKGAKA
jgi:5'-methylthioadenosine phosphorylase